MIIEVEKMLEQEYCELGLSFSLYNMPSVM